jgi:hypothetical protein
MTRTREIQPLAPDTQEYRAIRSALKNHHRGQGEAVSKPAILAGMERAGMAVERRVLDETLRAMRAAGDPVCGTGAGVFWAVRREELMAARHYCVARFDDLRETIRSYDRILERWGRQPAPIGAERKQTELFESSARTG